MKTIKTFTAAALVALTMGAASTAALADSPVRTSVTTLLSAVSILWITVSIGASRPAN